MAARSILSVDFILFRDRVSAQISLSRQSSPGLHFRELVFCKVYGQITIQPRDDRGEVCARLIDQLIDVFAGRFEQRFDHLFLFRIQGTDKLGEPQDEAVRPPVRTDVFNPFLDDGAGDRGAGDGADDESRQEDRDGFDLCTYFGLSPL